MRAALVRTSVFALALLVAGCASFGDRLRPVGGDLVGAAQQADRIRTIRPVKGWTDPELVPAPELFNASGVTLWNGQRTTRGIWAAHPEARGQRKVRMINQRTGAKVDGTIYRTRGRDSGEAVTLSSDAALVLGVARGDAASISLVALRPKGTQSPGERAQMETLAQDELVALISRMDEAELLKLMGAVMRGMGYDTAIADGPDSGSEPIIRANMPAVDGVAMPRVRVVVLSRAEKAMGQAELDRIADWAAGSGDLVVIASVPGFNRRAAIQTAANNPQLHLADLDSLTTLWLTQYERMSSEDQALLPLQPIYFVASN